MPLTPGTRLGRYEVIRLLGAGGMGEVYLAKDERLEREVALKVLPTGTLADESARKRFRREALALSKLNHPNIETVYDFDTEEGVDFLVMEYVAGHTLAEKLTNGALPEKEVVTLGGQIASALEEAHEQGVVHRDLKPGNILVTAKGQAKLLDFGLARLLEPVAESSQVQTISQTGSTAGTMPY
ncbi:MAG: serine/threonine-protein kinase, partial [Acidobacteriota bacterium]